MDIVKDILGKADGLSAEGKLLWQANQEDTDFFWITNITPSADGISVAYDNGGESAIASYDASGKLILHN